MDAKVFHSMTYGLYVLGVKTREQVGGCVVNTLFQVTSEPAVFAVCVNTQNNTCGMIEKAGLFTASVLTEDCPSETIGLYGFKSSRDTDKSSGMVLTQNGLPRLKEGLCAYMEFAVCEQLHMGTHDVFFARLISGETVSAGRPMSYAYYQTERKGKSPALAPTYVPEESRSQEAAPAKSAEAAPSGKKYVCAICGYEYSGDIPFEDLPDDWTCPVCGVPKSMFEARE